MLHKLLKVIYAGLLIGFGVAVTIMLHPIFFIAWVIYNRRNVPLWSALLILILSVLLPLQYYSFFSTAGHIHFWSPASNPFIIFGLCLTLFFLPTRLAAFKQFRTRKHRYYAAITVFILQLLWLLVPIIPIQLFMSVRHPAMQFVLIDIAILLWDAIVAWLYLSYPEDILARNLYQFILDIQKTINDR